MMAGLEPLDELVSELRKKEKEDIIASM